MDRLFASLGAFSGALAVALGAFAAHGLRNRVQAGALEPRMLEVFETGARYHMYHAVALIIVAWAMSRAPSGMLTASGWLFVAGTLLFSGSLYAMTLTSARALGAITPLGGVCFIAAWILLGLGFLRAR